MTDQPVSGSDPEKVLADALYDADEDYNGLHSVGERAAAILAAMPDHTIVRRSELAALRDPRTKAGQALLYHDASEEWIDMMRPSILAIEEQARVAPDERLREALTAVLRAFDYLQSPYGETITNEKVLAQIEEARALLATPPDPAPDERLLGLISQALSELGVPTPDYPAPIANAVAILQTAWPDVAEPKPASPAVEGE